jgi:hypothetical protein
MSRYFVLPEEGIGPGGDITFRRYPAMHGWKLFVGDTFFGIVSNLNGTWTGTSWAQESEFFSVRQLDGFATRLKAAAFVIKHHGYWMWDERERLAIAAEMDERMKGRS